MLEFHCSLHPLPTQPVERRSIRWLDREIAVFDFSTAHKGAHFGLSFDEVAVQLQAIPRLFWEPDGSFLWVGSEVNRRLPWRVSGQLNDGGATLAVFELRGYCRDAELDQLLRTVGWPTTAVVFQLCEAGAFVDEETFRALYLFRD